VERSRINDEANFAVEFRCARDSSVMCGFHNAIAPHGEAIVLGDVVSGDLGGFEVAIALMVLQNPAAIHANQPLLVCASMERYGIRSVKYAKTIQ
jgi:hypothetical protein